MTEEEIRKIIKETVAETLSGLGFNTKDIHETQADMAYLHTLRRNSEEVRSKIKTTIITVLVPTMIYVAWETFKSKIIGEK